MTTTLFTHVEPKSCREVLPLSLVQSLWKRPEKRRARKQACVNFKINRTLLSFGLDISTFNFRSWKQAFHSLINKFNLAQCKCQMYKSMLATRNCIKTAEAKSKRDTDDSTVSFSKGERNKRFYRFILKKIIYFFVVVDFWKCW